MVGAVAELVDAESEKFDKKCTRKTLSTAAVKPGFDRLNKTVKIQIQVQILSAPHSNTQLTN